MSESAEGGTGRPATLAASVVVSVADDVELRCLVRRGGDEVPFLFVHGLASNAHLWDETANSVARFGHDSVAVDQRGHGRSSSPDHGFDFNALSADLAAVITAMVSRPVVVVGQSWGGNVVLELAARSPELVAAVALVDGGFLRPADSFESWDAVARALAPPSFEGLTIEDVKAVVGRHDGFSDAAVSAQLANFEEAADGTVRARLGRHHHMTILRHLWDHNPDVVGAAVRAPILVIAVDRSNRAKQQRVTDFAAATGAEVTWMNGHHDIHAQQPQRIAEALVAFARAMQ